MSDEILEVHGIRASLLVLRSKRNRKLSESDWTQTNDIRLENEEEWVAYRQALRDLPSLETPIWPEQPQVKIVQGKNTWTELSDTKTELKADLQTTDTNLQATLEATKTELKADLQTTQTELTEERALHETTRTQLQDVLRKFEKLEMRTAYLESALIS